MSPKFRIHTDQRVHVQSYGVLLKSFAISVAVLLYTSALTISFLYILRPYMDTLSTNSFIKQVSGIPVKMGILSFISGFVAPIFIIISPITSYADQTYAIHRTKSSAGFSLDIPLIMLVASLLRYVLNPLLPQLYNSDTD